MSQVVLFPRHHELATEVPKGVKLLLAVDHDRSCPILGSSEAELNPKINEYVCRLSEDEYVLIGDNSDSALRGSGRRDVTFTLNHGGKPRRPLSHQDAPIDCSHGASALTGWSSYRPKPRDWKRKCSADVIRRGFEA